jgi:branched-chain amino acid transport system permease protein
VALSARSIAVAAGLLLLVLVPVYTEATGERFYLSLFGRIMIFAIAAVSLDLILGYGGMVSFGHAAYLGIGGYSVAIFSHYGIDNGFVQVAVALLGSAVVAAFIGLMSIRTSGLYFIMITLAFTQMLFFLGISLEEFGGDDGITTRQSEFFSWLELRDGVTLYYFILAVLVICAYLCSRFVKSRFGMVVRGSMSNDARMQAIGFSTFRYRLVAFVISGTMCGMAGLLLANLTAFVTPTYMHWFRSGEIMVMVLMGGMGTLFGPAYGAAVYLLLQDVLPDLTQHWQIFFGPFLVVLILFAKKGLWGLLPSAEKRGG